MKWISLKMFALFACPAYELAPPELGQPHAKPRWVQDTLCAKGETSDTVFYECQDYANRVTTERIIAPKDWQWGPKDWWRRKGRD